MSILNLEKSRQERIIKEYQKQCDNLFEEICLKMVNLEWTILQANNFVNKVLPELMRYEIERNNNLRKVDEVLKEIVNKIVTK